MNVIKQLLEKMRKTKDQRIQDSEGARNFKFDNQVKYHEKDNLHDSMHKIIKETTTGIAF